MVKECVLLSSWNILLFMPPSLLLLLCSAVGAWFCHPSQLWKAAVGDPQSLFSFPVQPGAPLWDLLQLTGILLALGNPKLDVAF